MSTVIAEPTPYFLELEQVTGEGPPRIRITVYNVPGTQKIRIVRRAGGETWTVPGIRSRQVTDTAVFVDWFAPLNTSISYTVSVGGVDQYTGSVTLHSDSAWLQDPLQPDRAVAVVGQGTRPGHLHLTGDSLQSVEYPAETSQAQVMGAKYPTIMGGQRQGAAGVQLVASVYDRATDGAFRTLIEDTSVLVFRPIGGMYPLPPLCYLSAQVSEQPLTSHWGGDLARWSVSGNLVAAVMQAAVSGMVTYAQVDELLSGYTYAEVQQVAASTTYLDWQKNPLIFTTL